MAQQEKVAFYATPTWQTVARGRSPARTFVAVERPVAKRAAKRDKRALQYARTHVVKPALAPTRAFDAAGLRHHRWQWI